MEFHMYAQTACTVADCITTLLSRKAKLKGENPPPAKLYISTFSHKAHWMGVHKISFFVCLSFCLPPTFSPIPVSGFQVSVSLTFIFFFWLCLFVSLGSSISHFFSSSVSLFSAYPSSSLPLCLSVCLHICLSLYSICLSAPSLPSLSVMSVQQHKKT